MKMLTIENRICELCGSNESELVWSDKSLIKTHKETYLFRAYIVVCRNCGFVYNSPCPKADDLNSYYSDSLSIMPGQTMAYSIKKRLQILKRYASPQGIFVEIGGNQSREFHKILLSDKFFKNVYTVELNQECSSDAKSLDVFSSDVDIIAHYDVLEHVPNVKEFLASCYRALKPRGIMICEVPDVRMYPRNLMLFSIEHVNHFSVTTLAQIANDCGFQLVEIGHNSCSRAYGFVSVFRKVSMPKKDLTAQDNSKNKIEYFDSLSCLKEGVYQINRFLEHIRFLRKKISMLGSEKRNITLWCVTDLMRPLLENWQLPQSAIVVDSDPRKKLHLKHRGISVLQPEECLKHIKSSDLLVICSPRNRDNILQWIKERTESHFDNSKLEVIGCDKFGEPLQ